MSARDSSGPLPQNAGHSRDGVFPIRSGPGAAKGRPFHVMGKPVGPLCNLDCKYCFYLGKESLFPPHERFAMSDAVLDVYIREFIAAQPGREVNFAWQGGEPTLLGVDFFRKVVALQARHANGKVIGNAMQTNGTLLDDEWGEFLRAHRFLVGVSIDGPRDLHDAHRPDKRQQPTFERVMAGIEVLKKHAVEFNTLTCVHRENCQEPLRVYRFLKEIGSCFIQFIPLVERVSPQASAVGPALASPPVAGECADSAAVTAWSVEPHRYGEFLVSVFEEWVRRDVGRVFVQLFDVALANWMGLGSGLCLFAEECGGALALEHNGDLYSCDHYVYPRYRLGNLLNTSLTDMANAPEQRQFGAAKRDALPNYCRRCSVRFACNGECPRNRFLRTPDGEPGLNYLCDGYQRFFQHIDPYMKMMGRLLSAQMPPAAIMGLLAERDRRMGSASRATAGSA